MTPNEKVVMTEFTLRKISKLVSKIDGRIHNVTGEVNDNITAPVVIHDNVDLMLEAVSNARDAYGDAFETLQGLLDVRVTLRGALGSANQSAGINYLVTELRGLEQKLSVVTQLLKSVPKENQLSRETLARRMEARQHTQLNTTINDMGYGSRRRANDDDSVDLPTLLEADIHNLEEFQRTFQDAIETTHDKLEQLNSSVGIELPEDVVEVLQDLDIIGL